MSDYISREAVLGFELKVSNLSADAASALRVGINAYFAYIRQLPAADVRPVVRGKWVQNEDCTVNTCDKCGYSFAHEGYVAFFNFCPNCGADMREEADHGPA